ncbi:MAG TPA: hypothetical protein VJ735_16000, partial [Actinomycetes bacterium]|nr:hypothetical protein [Actinomycetes bacterium]
RAANLLAPPMLAWLAANALYWAAADRAGFDYLLVRTHARWDSGNYLNIARHGYTLAHCVPRPTSPFSAADWCGTVGWFPLYPLGMRLVGGFGLTAPWAGLLLAELFALGTLGLAWWLLGARASPANVACLALAAAFPGSIYEHALFPVSLAVAGSLLYLALLADGRWTAAGIAGATSAAAYQAGILLTLVAPLWLLLAHRRLGLDPAAALSRAFQTSALVLVGLLAVMGLQQAETDRWDGFLLVEAKYGTGLHNPVTTALKNAVRQAPPPGASGNALAGQAGPRDQFRLVTTMAFVAVAATLTAEECTPLELAVLVYTVLFWLAPLVAGGHLAQYRMHALLTPSVLLLRRLPAAVIGALALLSVLVAWRMAGLFYQYILI